MTDEWEWDDSLYRGSAHFYERGRVPYPPGVAELLVRVLGLDGTGRYLDIGCGPGSLTFLLSPSFAETVGVDADAEMVAAGRRQATLSGQPTVTFRCERAEDLPDGLGVFDVVTFAQSFHWMKRSQVAGVVRRILAPGGVLVHVGATTHRGTAATGPLPHPMPPWDVIAELVNSYLGTVRRAGRGVLPAGTSSGQDEIYRDAGFAGPRTFMVPGGLVTRTADEVIAATFSLSSSAPHLFGTRLLDFESALRDTLTRVAPQGLFSEQMDEVRLDVWAPET